MSQPFGRGPATESHLEGSDRQIVLEAAIQRPANHPA
jgi:hypothetical protein